VAASEHQRPPQPYELQGVKLSWAYIPWQTCQRTFDTGWTLDNPEGLTCAKRYDGRGYVYCSEDWFSCRIRVDEITKRLTILTATECKDGF
jgi:hypothetical protein